LRSVKVFCDAFHKQTLKYKSWAAISVDYRRWLIDFVGLFSPKPTLKISLAVTPD
jgi:hypothetical protein